MARTLEYTPLVRWKSGMQGLAAGSLVASGILSGFGLVFQAVLFFAGIFTFIDSLIPDGDDTSPITTIGFTLLGIVVSVLGLLYGFMFPWSVIMLIAIVVFYFFKYSRKKK